MQRSQVELFSFIFYQFLWVLLKPRVCEMVNESNVLFRPPRFGINEDGNMYEEVLKQLPTHRLQMQGKQRFCLRLYRLQNN